MSNNDRSESRYYIYDGLLVCILLSMMKFLDFILFNLLMNRYQLAETDIISRAITAVVVILGFNESRVDRIRVSIFKATKWFCHRV